MDKRHVPAELKQISIYHNYFTKYEDSKKTIIEVRIQDSSFRETEEVMMNNGWQIFSIGFEDRMQYVFYSKEK